MSTLDLLEESFQENITRQYQGTERWQKEAWGSFLKVGLPSQRQEVFRYVRLRDLYGSHFTTHTLSAPSQEQINQSILPECKNSCLILINGVYHETLSRIPENLIAMPLSEAFKTYHAFLSQRWKKWLEEEKDPFALLNGALYREGLFLYLPPKCSLKQPIQILHIMTGDGMFVPRIHFFGGKDSSCKIFLNHQIPSEKYWVNSFFDLNLEERARVHLTTLLNENPSSSHVDAIRATLKRESHFESDAITNGSSLLRQDYSISLQGEQAEAEIYGVWSLSDATQAHVNVLMNHQEPHCRSLQKFKGILAGHSRSSFEGKIYVQQQAQKTEAFQMNNNLILSKNASANSKPNLEIFADDVKASHGATIGQLDEEQLFYLKSRGIDHALATKLLIYGFSQDILDRIELLSFRNLANQLLS